VYLNLFILFRFLDVFQTLRLRETFLRSSSATRNARRKPGLPHPRGLSPSIGVGDGIQEFNGGWKPQWWPTSPACHQWSYVESSCLGVSLLCLRPQSPQNKAFTTCFRSQVQDFDSNTQVCACVYSNFPGWNGIHCNLQTSPVVPAVRLFGLCMYVTKCHRILTSVCSHVFFGFMENPHLEVSNPWGYP
jgi:hypothetical protein